MTSDQEPRKPRVFALDDSRLGPSQPPPFEQEPSASLPIGMSEVDIAAVEGPVTLGPLRGVRWTSVFLTALGGLGSLALGVWIWDFVAGLFARGGLLGAVALILALTATVAVVAIAAREISGFLRLARVTAIRHQADAALADGDQRQALATSLATEKLLAGRADSAWGARRLRDHRRDVLDARELLIVTERELMGPLDARARDIIGTSVRRVAMITAVSPSAIVDVGFVALENLAMLRRLAALYGGRPGFLGAMRLARLVVGHLTVTGGMAIGDDVLQQLIGHGLTARLSARLGEGVLNGAFTGRIGIAAVELCRPLPFIESARPRLRDFVTQLRSIRRASTTAPQPPAAT